MKKTKYRRLAAMAASLLCCLIFTVPAYAQSSETLPVTIPIANPPERTATSLNKRSLSQLRHQFGIREEDALLPEKGQFADIPPPGFVTVKTNVIKERPLSSGASDRKATQSAQPVHRQNVEKVVSQETRQNYTKDRRTKVQQTQSVQKNQQTTEKTRNLVTKKGQKKK